MTTTHAFQAQPPISVIVTPNLKPEESARLLECINKVRSGERVYLVRITYHKVTNAPRRLPEQDYVPDPALRPNAHEGWLTEARLNKKGKLFIRLHDEARRPDDGHQHGFTCNLLDGIESFKVLGERSGPLAKPGREAPEPVPQAVQGQSQAQVLQMALAMQAQGMFMMGQAMVLMGQAMGQPLPAPPPFPGPPPVPPPSGAATPAPEPQPV